MRTMKWSIACDSVSNSLTGNEKGKLRDLNFPTHFSSPQPAEKGMCLIVANKKDAPSSRGPPPNLIRATKSQLCAVSLLRYKVRQWTFMRVRTEAKLGCRSVEIIISCCLICIYPDKLDWAPKCFLVFLPPQVQTCCPSTIRLTS